MVASSPPSYSLRHRMTALLCVFAALLSVLLCYLFRMQVFDYQNYQRRVLEQITVGAALKAERGEILDRNGNVLATNRTVWRIWVSPVDVRQKSREENRDYASILAAELSALLELDAEKVRAKLSKTGTLDQTLLRGCSRETAEKVLQYIGDRGYGSMVHVEAGTARYYPRSTLAAHTIGFTGSDNQGLFGLEAYYDDLLQGKDGQYTRAIDSTGKELPMEYSSYIAAEDGNTLHTTLDSFIQEQLELQLEAALENADAEARVCGCVMDVRTGAILAMATLPAYDGNDPYTLDAASAAKLAASGLTPGSTEYAAKKADLLYRMWNNKPVSETYEPGSTFKIMTAAMVLEEKAVGVSSRFNCPGYYMVGGWRISCHKRTGHGSGITFAYGLQQSCNPVMMQAAELLGSEKFYQYFSAFGYLEKTGVDLPSEAVGLFHAPEKLGSTELATASFGQRFKVSILAQLRAVAAVANGGVSVTPHLADYMTDKNGNIVWRYEIPEGTRIISEETARTVSTILEEGVAGAGGAKSAYAPGFRIAAKTGTSEKFDVLDSGGRSYLRIGSCVGYAPYLSAEIAAIIVVDEPTCEVKYGSAVAAPYLGALMTNILPYLGHEPVYTEREEALRAMVGDYGGKNKDAAVRAARSDGFSAMVVGDGDTVLSQIPESGAALEKGGRVILYTSDVPPSKAGVPDVRGKDAATANRLLAEAGFNVAFIGATGSRLGEGVVVTAQSVLPGSEAIHGSIITLTLTHREDTD